MGVSRGMRPEYDFLAGVNEAFTWYNSLSPTQQEKVGYPPPLMAAYPPNGQVEFPKSSTKVIECDPKVCSRLLRDTHLGMEKIIDEKRGGIVYHGPLRREPRLTY